MESIEEEEDNVNPDELMLVTCNELWQGNQTPDKLEEEFQQIVEHWKNLEQRNTELELKLKDARNLIMYLITAYLLFSIMWFGPEVTLLVVLVIAIASIAYERPWVVFFGTVSGACTRYWRVFL